MQGDFSIWSKPLIPVDWLPKCGDIESILHKYIKNTLQNCIDNKHIPVPGVASAVTDVDATDSISPQKLVGLNRISHVEVHNKTLNTLNISAQILRH